MLFGIELSVGKVGFGDLSSTFYNENAIFLNVASRTSEEVQDGVLCRLLYCLWECLYL